MGKAIEAEQKFIQQYHANVCTVPAHDHTLEAGHHVTGVLAACCLGQAVLLQRRQQQRMSNSCICDLDSSPINKIACPTA